MTEYLNRNPPRFNAMVHVDETFVGGKCKYRSGRNLAEPKWLFGIVYRANHKCFLPFIPDKSLPSIIPIIQCHCQQEFIYIQMGHKFIIV